MICGLPPQPPSESGLKITQTPEFSCPGLGVTYTCDVGGVNKFAVSLIFYHELIF